MNRRPAPTRWVALILLPTFGLAVLLSGCARPTAVFIPPSSAAPAPSAKAKAARPAAADTTASLEGRFTFQTMDQYVDAVVPMITQWIDQTYRGQLPLPTVEFVPHGATGPEPCTAQGDGEATGFSDTSYEYCGEDQVVYLGQDTLFTFYKEAGDAGPAVGIAHEFGHHLQQLLGVPAPRSAAESIRHENQADCIAGAWTQYTDQQGWLEYPDDIQDVGALFPLIGSAEGVDRDHGTADERAAAFQRGFLGGLTACTTFYPSAPLS